MKHSASTSTTFVLVGVWVLTLCDYSTEYSVQLGLKWGEKCKIPGPNEFFKASEECEMSKGLNCQTYQQGNLCGCPIRSSLSYDEQSGECRRKPGHHCPFVNATENPGAYERLSYNHKCHARAECMIVEPIPEMQKQSNKKSKPEQFAVCKCKRGYKENRDGLVCHNVNSVDSLTSNYTYTLALFMTVSFLTHFSLRISPDPL